MADLKDFLKNTGDDATALGSVTLALGADLPFCLLRLRAFHPEGDEGGDLSITRRTHGVRAVLLSGETYEFGNHPKPGNIPARLPTLLRVAARPRDYTGAGKANALTLWYPAAETPIEATIAQSDAAQDLLAVPEPFEDLTGKDAIHLPALRLVQGAAKLSLELGNGTNALARFLRFDRTGNTIFGGVAIDAVEKDKSGDLLWPVKATPQGLTFPATIADPTSGLTEDTADRLKAIVRLEADPARDSYRLRLVGPATDEALEGARTRLQQVVTDLIKSEAPQRYRIDLRDETPPLIWPLDLHEGQLRLVPVPADPSFALAEIDPAHVDLRLITQAHGVGEGSAQARVELTRVELHSTAQSFELQAHAGRARADATYSLNFERSGDRKWTPLFDGTFGPKSISLPMDRLRERLTTRYRDAGLIGAETETAPYAFFALHDGWMQMPLPKGPIGVSDDLPGFRADAETETEAANALSGRLLFSASSSDARDEALPRVLELSSAEGLRITTTWKGTSDRRLERFKVEPTGEAGTIYGFLFVANTSPDEYEAVPDWTRGPAAVGEVPLGFDNGSLGEVTFQWTASGDTSDWELTFALPDAPEDADTLAWVTMQNAPFITNYPMSRSAKSAPVPSRSRGLFPRALSGQVRLHFQITSGVAVENDLPVLLGADAGTTAPGAPYGPAPVDPVGARFMQSALLPTLHGVEFKPDPGALAWSFTAALRYDYPVLDELFAWSDLPPVEPENAQTQLTEAPEPPVVTALHPARLAALWRDAEQRMQLTWTQDAVITNTLEVNTESEVALETLAYPHVFEQSVTVEMSQDRLFGNLAYDDDQHGARDGLDRAAVGLGGALSEDDDGLTLASANMVPRVHVTGYGIDQYAPPAIDWRDKDAAHHLSDARGTSMRTRATRDGTLRQLRQYKREDGQMATKEVVLHTMPEPTWFSMSIGSETAYVSFHARDVPLDPETHTFTGVRETASLDATDPPNPIESYRSNTGRAFDRGGFGQSLYEWRCYPKKPPQDVLGTFDIPIGPFRFRPLRLIAASFDKPSSDTEPLSLTGAEILGGLSFRSDGNSTPRVEFAFGPDRIYDRDDLFVFRTTDRPRWQGAAVAPGKTDDEVTWKDRAPTVTFTRRLPAKCKGEDAWFTSDDDVAAEITLSFNTDNGALDPETATLRAQLFGELRQVTGGTIAMEGDSDVLKITFDENTIWEPPLPAALQDITMVATCSASGADQSLAIDGKVDVLAQGDGGPVLFRLDKGAVQWLDLELSGEGIVPTIDHDAGALRYTAYLKLDGVTAPLFGLPMGDEDAKTTLSISLAEVLSTTGPDRVFHFLADLRVGDGTQYRLNHEVLLGTGKDETDVNRLRLTWRSKQERSPIEWRTLDGVSLSGEPNLTEIIDGPLAPPDYGNSGAPSRLLTLAPTTERIAHDFEFRLTDFFIDPATLTRKDTRLLPLTATLRGLAQVQHTLRTEQHEKTWWSCDFIALATAPAMRAEAGVLPEGVPQINAGKAIAFVPRQNHHARQQESSAPLEYRGAPEHVDGDHLPEGTARMENANLSGWHDPGMTEYLWNELEDTTVFVVAIAPLWMTDHSGRRAHQINLPWAYGLPDGTALQTPPDTGQDTYRIPTMESWAAHPLAATGGGAIVALNTQMREVEMLAALTDGKARLPDLRAMLPATPGLFEPWENDAPGPIDSRDRHARAPYFLRAMLALAAHWSGDTASAPVMSLVPDTIWRSKDPPSDPPHQTRARRAQLRDRTALLTNRDRAPDPVDLVILAPSGAVVVPSYRQARTDKQGWAKPAELFDAAHRRVEDARFALFRVNAKGLASGRSVARARDPLERAGAALTPRAADIVASPALGWPMDPVAEPGNTFAPGFEAEHALQSPTSGFAGRSQRTLWPATATAPANETAAIETLALRFSEHVVFDRGPAPFPHDGPAVRHLAPAMARRRAPLPIQDIPRDEWDYKLWAPIMPPVVDRLVIGRRPGVLDTTTASATLVRAVEKPALDTGWPGTGQPASSGPVIGAQMRNPRSPVLPPHPEGKALFDGQSPADQALRLSRRTYLSRADGPLETNKLAPFVHHGFLSDTLRVTARDGIEWCLSLSGFYENITLPSTDWWPGRINLALDARAVDLEGNGAASDESIRKLFGVAEHGTVADQITAQLFLGTENWEFIDVDAGIYPDGIQISLGIRHRRYPESGAANLKTINDLLRQADADTPMRLHVQFHHLDGTDELESGWRELPMAGLARFSIPVLLSPRNPRSIPVRTETLNFGDPSYDRALGSPTLAQPLNVGDERMLVSLDRQKANPDTQLHIAFDHLDEVTGGFLGQGDKPKHPITLSFVRVPFRTGIEIDPPEEEELLLWRESREFKDYVDKVVPRRALILRLDDLFVPKREDDKLVLPPDSGSPLRPGDTLRIECTYGPYVDKNADTPGNASLHSISFNLPIVAGPVIPPAPSVFSFIEEVKPDKWQAPQAARIRLHASAPLPTRIEYPDLLGDMGRGHVRRQGLFVWHYGLPEQADNPLTRRQHLLKIDRSGGTQLPDPD